MKRKPKRAKSRSSEHHLHRVRKICSTMPESTEKLSHGEPTFFVRKRVFTMFADNHHNDGHIAVWLPAPPGCQEAFIRDSPEKFFRPPYVGPAGWIGVELDRISDADLAALIQAAWRMVAPKKLAEAASAPEARKP